MRCSKFAKYLKTAFHTTIHSKKRKKCAICKQTNKQTKEQQKSAKDAQLLQYDKCINCTRSKVAVKRTQTKRHCTHTNMS